MSVRIYESIMRVVNFINITWILYSAQEPHSRLVGCNFHPAGFYYWINPDCVIRMKFVLMKEAGQLEVSAIFEGHYEPQ